MYYLFCGMRLLLYKSETSSQIHSPLLGDKVDYGMGLSYRPASLCCLTGRYEERKWNSKKHTTVLCTICTYYCQNTTQRNFQDTEVDIFVIYFMYTTPWISLQRKESIIATQFHLFRSWLQPREYWMVYKGQAFLAVVWFGSSLTPFPPVPASKISLFFAVLL
jgi:Pyruvate/2-oxoacid:ferredoxin oxidoreductase delta subunit